VCGTLGSNLGPAWIDKYPELTIALSSRNRNLFGSVPYIHGGAYAVIGFVRLMLAGVTLFLLGRWYGRKAVEWAEGQVGELPAIYRWFHIGVDRVGWAMVLLMPGSNLVCLMAGKQRWPVARFVPLLVVGIILKLIVLWIGGQIFEDQIRWFLDVIERYQWWIVIGLFALTFLQSFGRVRKALPEVVEEIEHPGGLDAPDAESSAAIGTEDPGEDR
jgi:uncharacterized membrane protein YdjX (TVP38/TMEM64 family)